MRGTERRRRLMPTVRRTSAYMARSLRHAPRRQSGLNAHRELDRDRETPRLCTHQVSHPAQRPCAHQDSRMTRSSTSQSTQPPGVDGAKRGKRHTGHSPHESMTKQAPHPAAAVQLRRVRLPQPCSGACLVRSL